MGKVFCAVCHKRCKGDILKIEEQFVHHKCFQCIKCHKNLQQGGFFVREHNFYCPDDYQIDFGVKCEVCHTFVEGEVVTVLGKTFHTQCFRCSNCRRLFTSGERTTIFDDAYYCTSCAPGLTNGILSIRHTGDTSTPATSSQVSSYRGFESQNGVPMSSIASWTQKTSPTKFLTSTPHPHTAAQSINQVVSNGVENFVDGQLTVQISENGYTTTELGKTKTEHLANHIDAHGDSTVLDTILSTTPGQTCSAGSFILSTNDRRICPPGVDYGRHYPVSYLQLAEKGLTAIMSSEEVPLHSGRHDVKLRTQSLLRPTIPSTVYAYERPSRRDAVRSTSSPRFVSTNVASISQLADPTSSASPDSLVDHDGMKYNSPSTYSIPSSHTPASFTGRPRRDLYVRRRELSPGNSSLSSSVTRYPIHSGRTELMSSPRRSHTDRTTSRSTPNVRGKRGMTMLAESLMHPRVQPDRSLSPDIVTECWAEARRLASYPNARIPDSTSLPAIERFDFPAPPSPAVVMLEKRREKRLADQQSASNTLGSEVTLKNGTLSSVTSPDTELAEIAPKIAAKLHQIDAEIETLKRLGESSGITAALIQELEASKLTHIRGPDLDPVSASRSPSANTEPNYKTRYDRHVFASPSRDTRRDRHTTHTVSYRMDYSSTGGRSGTILSFPSTPRPGYTSGILYGRAVSLPRSTVDMNGYDSLGTTQTSRTPTTGPRTSTLPSTQIGLPSRGPPLSHVIGSGSGEHTLITDDSLHTTLGGMDSQVNGRMGVESLATSALSMDGLTVCSGDDTVTMAPSAGAYVLKSGTLTGLSSAVTGLRPVSALMKQQALLGRVRSRTHTPMRHTASSDCDSELMLDGMDAYPSVQSWLRSSRSRKNMSFKIYPYEQLKVSTGQLPRGVDRSHLERHLNSHEFEALFGMQLSAFQRLPEWKRNDLKRKVDLI